MKRLVLPLVALLTTVASAKTVFWYAMDEGAVGSLARKPMVCRDGLSTLQAEPKSFRGATVLSDHSSNPTFAKGFPADWQVADPVSGKTYPNVGAMRFAAAGLLSPASGILLPDGPALHLSTFTFETFVRFNPDEPTGKWWQVLAVKPALLPDEKTDSWGLRITGEDEIVARFAAPEEGEPRPPTTIRAKGVTLNDGKWHHVALVVDNVWSYSARLYVDYVLYDASGLPWEVWYDSAPLVIGANVQTPGPVRGLMDEIRLSDEALTPEKFLRPVAPSAGVKPPFELEALFKGLEDAKRPSTSSKKRERESITWKNFNQAEPGLTALGRLAVRSSSQIKGSKWSVGCETLDRDYADFSRYAQYVGELGVKRARLFSGWAKTEKEKGVYDFAWLDRQVRALPKMGVKPWLCLSYGNPVYKSGLNLGAGVAGVMGNPEGRAAWLRYCGEVVRRYCDVVDEWEVWNEPFGKQMEPYSEMLMETAEVIRGIQPKATVMASAVGAYSNNEKVLELLQAKGKAHLIDCWHYHPYIPNPDEPNGWWGHDTVEKLRKLVARYNPKARVVQGEVGCPAQLEFGHALCNRPWTEYSQAKWTLRRMTGEAVRGIAYNVFSMVDLQYKDYMLQSFGLLRMDLGKRFVYRRPNFYAVQNEVNLLDDDVQPVGFADSLKFELVRRADCRETAKRRLALARFVRKGLPLAFVWYSDRDPGDALEWDRVSLEIPAIFEDPVWLEMITGRVYAIDRGDWIRTESGSRFSNLPVWDSPIAIVERRAIDVR